MTTQKNTLNSSNHHAQTEKKSSSNHHNEGEVAVNNFVRLYDARAKFFADAFVKKVKEGSRKALAELQRHSLPPTHMDLRHEFEKCLKANISDAHTFLMKDGKR